MNGTWAGFRPLETQFQLCGTVVGSVGNQWRRFGSKFRNACRLGLAEMMQRAGVEGLDPDGNPYFFDLYLQVRDIVHCLMIRCVVFPFPVLFCPRRSRKRESAR